MRLQGVVYECADLREGVDSISGIVRLFPIAGGFEAHRYGGGGAQFILADDHNVEDNEDLKTIIVYTDQGNVIFVEPKLSDFEHSKVSGMMGTPKFKTLAEMHDYFYQRLTMDYF